MTGHCRLIAAWVVVALAGVAAAAGADSAPARPGSHDFCSGVPVVDGCWPRGREPGTPEPRTDREPGTRNQEPAFLPQASTTPAAGAERLVDVRIQGNYATPDDEVLRIAGVSIGTPVPADLATVVEARLRASGRFDEVEVRKRYRSFTALDEVALVIIVREHPTASPDEPPPGPFKRTIGRILWLPVLDYTDGYGFTFGARASFVDLIGKQGRVSVPLTWGGTRRAAVEIDKGFTGAVVDRVLGGMSISQRENPHYEVDDRRFELTVGAQKSLLTHLRLGAHGGWTDVDFGGLEDRFATLGADLVLDTRANPAYPRNAAFLRGSWTAFAIQDGPTINRIGAEGRGYAGLWGSAVLSARALYERSGRATPPYLQVLVGGADSLRGFRAGAFAGDNRLVSSLELRMPLTSPLSVGRFGVDLFVDAGTAYADGERLGDATWEQGAGAGVFLLLPLLQFNLDVARGSDGDWRVHVMTGFRF
jgi:hypothetical protein